MTRPIKFRAWDKDRNVMHFFDRDFGIELGDWYLSFSGRVYERHDDTGGDFEVENIELMQFINALDKHGAEIFDGDILKSKRKGNYVVKWDGGGWKLSCIENGRLWKNYKTTASTSLEIIGNIYENPELLP